ncbi:MAG: hypothetical protein A2049_00415 [Elusimicrobia bacterium GWA2_62_23]|nr:MAG: hypothetical protein A2049_00415 [Elusimicrobia bacterium GWA2_62_23]OGR71618.1 MAG: hypothetical protein A2179_05140 [Elusimicrobia bacterium GWC2_63_65]
MKNIKSISVAAMALFLAGCDEIKFNGTMNVLEQITFSQSQNQTVVVAPGQFAAKVTLSANNSKKKIKMEIKNADPATEVKLEFSKDIAIGETFNITAAQMKQNFDLAGTMATKVTRSEERSTYESCTYQYPQTVCRSNKAADQKVSEDLVAKISEFAAVEAVQAPEMVNPVPAEKAPYPGQFGPVPPHTPTCYTQWVSRPGTRYVRYFIETTDRDIDAGFVQNGKTLGSFKGHSTQNETVYTYQSDCH